MRVFIVYSRKGPTSPFDARNLPGSGRVDLIARCVSSALWLSHSLRPATIHIVSEGPSDPPKTITFTPGMKMVSPDERSIALWINKILSGGTNPGITAEKKSFQQLVKEYAGRPLYVLHEKGIDIQGVKIKSDPVFILGDHIGMPKKLELYCNRFGAEKISVGPASYLASQCITYLNIHCDRAGLE